jgi:hypothetical protein
MSYDLHITRSELWFESEENAITFEEWRQVIEDDPELTLTGFAETKLPDGSVLRMEDKGLAVWEKRGLLKKSHAWFYHANGQIQVSGPDKTVIEKMKSIAEKLRARVVGDECEEY